MCSTDCQAPDGIFWSWTLSLSVPDDRKPEPPLGWSPFLTQFCISKHKGSNDRSKFENNVLRLIVKVPSKLWIQTVSSTTNGYDQTQTMGTLSGSRITHMLRERHQNIGRCTKKRVEKPLFVERLLEQLFHRGIVRRVKFLKFLGVGQFHMETYPAWTRGLPFTVRTFELGHRFGHRNNTD